jgi:hypothetical protein
MKPGRPRTHDEEQIAQLLNMALTRKPKAATHWSVRMSMSGLFDGPAIMLFDGLPATGSRVL